MTFEVSSMVKIVIMVFQVMALYSLEGGYRNFRGTCCLHLQVKTEAGIKRHTSKITGSDSSSTDNVNNIRIPFELLYEVITSHGGCDPQGHRERDGKRLCCIMQKGVI
jgi:hypothetical protein